MTEPRRNADGTWTITIIKDGKSYEQVVRLEVPLDQVGWHDTVDETADTAHNESVANEANQ